jgi:hypothetical protein
MSLEKTKAQLIEMLDNSDNNVIALSGKWGAGKTHLWEDVRGGSGDDKVKNSLYVSLFGLSNVDQIKRKLMEVAIPGAEEHGGTVEVVKNMVKVGFKALAEHYKALAAVNDLNLLLMAPVVLREKLIVIDDIERKHEKLGIDEVLGFIDEYSKQFDVRFLLVLNDDQLSQKTEQEHLWTTFREKVIDQEIRLATTPEEAFGIAIHIWPSKYEPALRRAVMASGITNIRIIGKIVKAANQILAGRDLSEAIQARCVPSIALFSAIHYRGLEDGPSFQFALNVGNPDWARISRKEKAEPTEEEKREDRWRMLISELGIHSCDDFEKVLVEFLESGLFVGDQVQAIINRYVSEGQTMEARQNVRAFITKAIWDHRVSETDLVAEAASFPAVAPQLDPYLSTELYDILAGLEGGQAVGTQVIQAWIVAFQGVGGTAPNDENPFGNPLHSDIRAVFDAANAHAQAQATVVDACNHIVEQSGWGTMQEVAMKRATTADFESAIRDMNVESLPKFMRRMIQMRLQRGTYDPHFGNATERFMDACRAIANDPSPESARLAKLMKRLFAKTALATELDLSQPVQSNAEGL